MRELLENLSTKWLKDPPPALIKAIARPANITVTLSSFAFPGSSVGPLSALLSAIGCTVVPLNHSDSIETWEHVADAATAMDSADAHIVFMTTPWLEQRWGKVELVKCVNDGVPALVFAYAKLTNKDADVRHLLHAIPAFDPHTGNEAELERCLARVLQKAVLRRAARAC